MGSKLNGQPLGSDEHVSFWHIHLMKYHPAFDNKCSGYWMEWGNGYHHKFIGPLNTSKYVANIWKRMWLLLKIFTPVPNTWLWVQPETCLTTGLYTDAMLGGLKSMCVNRLDDLSFCRVWWGPGQAGALVLEKDDWHAAKANHPIWAQCGSANPQWSHISMRIKDCKSTDGGLLCSPLWQSLTDTGRRYTLLRERSFLQW